MAATLATLGMARRGAAFVTRSPLLRLAPWSDPLRVASPLEIGMGRSAAPLPGPGRARTFARDARRRDRDAAKPEWNQRPDEESTSVSRHVINWYPGHIAKAEKELQDFLKLVDVVIEARDARIPSATTHPLVRQWVGRRPLIVAMTRKDMAPPAATKDWQDYYIKAARRASREGQPRVPVVFVDARQGVDIHRLKMIALKAGAAVNQRRKRLGLLPRSIRVAVIGYPNVGKSAIINKLIGRKLAKSKNMPGVTKRISWVRLGAAAMGGARKEEELELLDSPGIIPAKQVNQDTALKLAVCNDIGQASYDVQVVAAELVNMLKAVADARPGYVDLDRLQARYQLDARSMTGEEFLYALAAKLYRGNLYSAADRLMGDFRRGLLGATTLELPPAVEDEEDDADALVAPGAEARAEAVAARQRREEATALTEQDEKEEGEGEGEREGEGEVGHKSLLDDSITIGRGQFEGW